MWGFLPVGPDTLHPEPKTQAADAVDNSANISSPVLLLSSGGIKVYGDLG